VDRVQIVDQITFSHPGAFEKRFTEIGQRHPIAYLITAHVGKLARQWRCSIAESLA